jgi:biotin transporter BioY
MKENEKKILEEKKKKSAKEQRKLLSILIAGGAFIFACGAVWSSNMNFFAKMILSIALPIAIYVVVLNIGERD